MDFIARNTAADGVLSTKASLTRRAKELGLVAIQRFFLLDSMAIENISRHLGQETSDLIEVLPGIMPKIIRRVRAVAGKPGDCRRAHHRQGGCHRGPGGRRGGRVHHQSCGMGHVRPPSRIFSKIVYPFQRKGEWNEPRPQEGAGLVPLFFDVKSSV